GPRSVRPRPREPAGRAKPARLRRVEPRPPPPGTLEAYAYEYVTSPSLAWKLAPGPAPEALEVGAPARRLAAPGRPPDLRLCERAPRLRRFGSPRGRAQVLATFLHHELQAAELMCWALLAFPEAPEELRRGLMRVFADEVRHMAL